MTSNDNFEALVRRAIEPELPPTWLMADTFAALSLCEPRDNVAAVEIYDDDRGLPTNVRGATLAADYVFKLTGYLGDELTIEVDVIIEPLPGLEGRISPVIIGEVQLVSRTQTLVSDLDEYGRFGFDEVPRGPVRFAVELGGPMPQRIVSDWVVIQPRSIYRDL